MAYTYTYKPYAGVSSASPNPLVPYQAPSSPDLTPAGVGSYFQSSSVAPPYYTQYGNALTAGATAATAAGASAPTAPGSTPSAPAGLQIPDWSQDPILLKQRALDAKMVADAQAGALAGQKTQLINYGDPALALSLLHDQGTAAAAKNNQFSTLAQLLAGYTRGQNNLNEALSNHNLFYSSTRVNDLTEAGKQYQGQKYNAAGAVQGALSQIAQQLLQARYQAQQADLNAEESAYMRALQGALANMQYTRGGGSGDSTAAPTASTLASSVPGLVQQIAQTNYIPSPYSAGGYLIHGV